LYRSYILSADNCKKGLEPLKVYKPVLTGSLQSNLHAPKVPYLMTRKRPHLLVETSFGLRCQRSSHQSGGFYKRFPLFCRRCNLLLSAIIIVVISSAKVCLYKNYMPSTDDCKRGLEPLKTYKIGINGFLASFTQLGLLVLESQLCPCRSPY
jgi:hypothetical protein